jgi:hypothetical protein
MDTKDIMFGCMTKKEEVRKYNTAVFAFVMLTIAQIYV